MLHSNIAEGDMHFIQQWTVADTTARDALSVAAADVGKVCEVGAAGAEKTFYILADDSPMTWTEIGGGGAGDVVGPASATDNAIVRFDSTTGKLIQDSGITIADGASGTLAGTNSGDVTLNASVADIFGLTGQEITADDPAADRLVFWDDSAGKLTYLEAGSGLTITGTTITASGGAGGAGTPLQIQYSETTTQQSTASSIPFDNTIPQSTEGAAITGLSTTLTPQFNNSKLLVELVVPTTSSPSGAALTFAIFDGISADAICANYKVNNDAQYSEGSFSMSKIVTVADTNMRTFTARWGVSGGTAYLNRNSANTQTLGGVQVASLKVTEIKQ